MEGGGGGGKRGIPQFSTNNLFTLPGVGEGFGTILSQRLTVEGHTIVISRQVVPCVVFFSVNTLLGVGHFAVVKLREEVCITTLSQHVVLVGVGW